MPDEHALRRAQLKGAAKLRAELNYDIACRRVDFTLDVIKPAMQEIAEKFAKGELQDPEQPELS